MRRMIVLMILGLGVVGQISWSAPENEDAGFEMGIFQVYPELEVLGAYQEEENVGNDYYTQGTASLNFNNADALYGIGGAAHYGYRVYQDQIDANDDFYGIGANLGRRDSPLRLGASAYHSKTVDYAFQVQDENDVGNLPSILTGKPSKRTIVRADVGYEKMLEGRVALLPAYGAAYYNQDIEGQSTLEWHTHTLSLRGGYSVSESTLLSLTGSYSFQFGNDEDGSVASIMLGAENRLSDKLSWGGTLGVSMADYEDSGTDQDVGGSLNVRWMATDRLSAYIFGQTSYETGAGGSGARRVYRAGYGGSWAMLERLRLNIQFLHDRQEYIQTDRKNASHFSTAELAYAVGQRVTLTLAGRYIAEESDNNETVASLGARMWF